VYAVAGSDLIRASERVNGRVDNRIAKPRGAYRRSNPGEIGIGTIS
jgi:hypothetical protein